nr:immunoglobulin heavy chain junction region [Macaca mulatta]MOW32623.1 immunoglobulin heavy chain junction region [Macaca mulatta]MOW33247.1 immunoglobulin heavy chain junction region [Macaca mulatta]MOW33375.1 immunoglobulin heavy chain junction region [Macaca mulatta]MOW33482.1 immunoglobulin heavy chain junction region [Macaca mulatta]
CAKGDSSSLYWYFDIW